MTHWIALKTDTQGLDMKKLKSLRKEYWAKLSWPLVSIALTMLFALDQLFVIWTGQSGMFAPVLHGLQRLVEEVLELVIGGFR